MSSGLERSMLNLGNVSSAGVRELVSLARSLRTADAPRLSSRGPIGLLLGEADPYARAAVEGGAALVGLRVVTYTPAEVAALGEGRLAGARLSYVHPLIIGVGLPSGALLDIASGSRRPVLNAGDADSDPLGAIADLALLERQVGALPGRRLTWVGDSSGLLYDLLLGGTALGMSVAIAHPLGFAPDGERLTSARERAAETGAAVLVTHELAEAMADASFIYVDVWPEDHVERFRPFAVQRHTLREARPGAIVLHRHPERRGGELSASFADEVGVLAVEQLRARVEACAAALAVMLRPDPLCSVLG